MKGVMLCKNCVSKPYCIAVMKAVGKQTKKYYATEAEATAALASYNSTRVQVKRDARQALVGKRTTDIARYRRRWRMRRDTTSPQSPTRSKCKASMPTSEASRAMLTNGPTNRMAI